MIAEAKAKEEITVLITLYQPDRRGQKHEEDGWADLYLYLCDPSVPGEDGSPAQKAKMARLWLEQRGWLGLLNVAYSQEDNPAEYLLNDVKHAFRRQLLENAALRSKGEGGGEKTSEAIAAEVLAKVSQQQCQQVILRCLD